MVARMSRYCPVAADTKRHQTRESDRTAAVGALTGRLPRQRAGRPHAAARNGAAAGCYPSRSVSRRPWRSPRTAELHRALHEVPVRPRHCAAIGHGRQDLLGRLAVSGEIVALPPADALRVHDTWVVAARPMGVVRWLVRQRRPGRYHSHQQGAPRGPLLLACGGKDRVVLEADASDIHRRNRRLFPDSVTDLEVFPDRDHALTVDNQWLAIAFYCLDWMTAHDL
jgi:hypothetical protein